ncbi:MAG: DUF4239 domain-containing protein [Candidatus Eremiobacteraeota bacterium]|nr:DUF4239 domain-containing protein [Candidatus Eremiobacteraeota bacterium]
MTHPVAFFEWLPLPVGAVVVVGGFVLLSVLLAKISRRFAPPELLTEHNELTGFIFAVVGVIYAVVLGFIAIGVWERFSGAQEVTYREASNLATIYRDAASLPGAGPLRNDLRVYVRDVIVRGWPAMQSGHPSDDTEVEAERVSRDVTTFDPRGARETNLHQQMIAAMAESLSARDERLTEDATGLNGLMWITVVLGGFITVGFTYLFGFKQSFMQTAMVGTLAFLIGLVIFLTMSLDYPFRGTVHVTPDAFERALTTFDTIDARR